MNKKSCGCPLANFPVKYRVSVEDEHGNRGYILLTQEQIDKLKEKLEIREVFK